MLFASLAVSQAVAQTNMPDPVAAATEVVASLHQALARVATDDAANDIDKRYAVLAPVITTTHNIPAIARFVLRRYWSDLGDDQQASFIELFTTLSVMNYASRFTSLEPDAFRIIGADQVAEQRVRVDAELRAADGRNVSFVYTLLPDEGKWRIVNVVADGVSDLALRRSEYSRLMQDKGFADLLNHIDSQIAALY